jgi:hypothetical protein
MDLVTRAKNICLSPATEWAVIENESTTTGELLGGYAAPLAAIGAVAAFIGQTIIGVSVPFVGTYRYPFGSALVGAVFGFVGALVACFLLGLIIDALAPTFNGQKNSMQALKVAVYSATPGWIAGALQIIPVLGILGILAGLYGLYLLYLGLPRLMKAPQDKAVPYTIVVIIVAIVLFIVIGAVTALFVSVPRAAFAASTSSSDVQFDKNSPLGKLQDIAKQAEASGKKIEAAEKAGDSKAATAAAVEGLGALLGGGKRVDPLDVDQLKPFVPETLAGLKRASYNAEKSGIAGLQVSKAEAQYEDGGGKSIELEISDTGGVSGVMAFAGWAGIEGVREDDNGSERTQKIDGRLVHEKTSKSGGTNEYAVVLGDRFVVSAKGDGVDVNTLKSAVSTIDLAKLESMKTVGVK